MPAASSRLNGMVRIFSYRAAFRAQASVENIGHPLREQPRSLSLVGDRLVDVEADRHAVHNPPSSRHHDAVGPVSAAEHERCSGIVGAGQARLVRGLNSARSAWKPGASGAERSDGGC